MLKKQTCMVLVGLVSLITQVFAGDLLLVGKTDKPSALYEPGEKMVFSVQLMDGSNIVKGAKMTWQRTGDDAKSDKGEAVSGEQPLQIITSTDKPGFVKVVVSALDEHGKVIEVGQDKKRKVMFEGGAGVQPEKLVSCPEPKDFDAFWAKQKAELAKVPVKAKMTEVPSKNPKFVVFDVKVDCAGGKPVSGYLVKPKDAAPKSLQAQVNFMGYGVNSANPSYADGFITLSINAHGIENGKEPEFYENLKKNELKGYAFNNTENSNPETAYFRGMMLRVMRALEFVKSQPEWNGKDLTASGGSQGGLQSLTAAGLDKDVTKCFAYKPWCCDLGGINMGRLRGWRPDYTAALEYFDPVNHAKRIKAETSITTGLGDYVCPPSGISVLYNNIQSAKKLEYIQGSTHGYNPPNPSTHSISSK